MSNGKQFTWVADEKLTGWERAYAEVRRVAALNERIKMTLGNKIFKAGTVIRVHLNAVIGPFGIKYVDGVCGTYGGEYVVLEPTDIVRKIDETAEYRLVDRNGRKGEYLVFEWGTKSIIAGKPYLIVGADHDGGEFKDEKGSSRWQRNGLKPKHYVLEPTIPVTSGVSASSPDCSMHLPLLDGTLRTFNGECPSWRRKLRSRLLVFGMRRLRNKS